ncbi:uncharacterized protein LOC144617150 [Panthera onca]
MQLRYENSTSRHAPLQSRCSRERARAACWEFSLAGPIHKHWEGVSPPCCLYRCELPSGTRKGTCHYMNTKKGTNCARFRVLSGPLVHLRYPENIANEDHSNSPLTLLQPNVLVHPFRAFNSARAKPKTWRVPREQVKLVAKSGARARLLCILW